MAKLETLQKGEASFFFSVLLLLFVALLIVGKSMEHNGFGHPVDDPVPRKIRRFVFVSLMIDVFADDGRLPSHLLIKELLGEKCKDESSSSTCCRL